MMTWTHQAKVQDWGRVTTDEAAFFIADGATGSWRISARAQPGEPVEDLASWQPVLTTGRRIVKEAGAPRLPL